MKKYSYAVLCMVLCTAWISGGLAQPVIVNHLSTDITAIPESAILQAKASLHIAYGHTSHGSQLVSGMNGLVGFMNGLGYPHNLYGFNAGGSNGALDFRDTPFSGAEDLGNPDRTSWATATRNYLNTHPAVNVIIWSWCGQVSGASEANINTYLSLMTALEQDFPSVRFVYMTGHLDGSGAEGSLNIRNEQIRNYCTDHGKVLYDFADIESYDPDGLVNYMPLYANDNCDYENNGEYRNWAEDWQAAHIQGTDWYDCDAAHSQALNGNRKAYAAWWLWARLAGWAGPVQDDTAPAAPQNLTAAPVNETEVGLSWSASSDAESGIAGYRIYRDGVFAGYTVNTTYADEDLVPGSSYTYTVSAVNGAGLESDPSPAAQADTPSDNEAPDSPGNLTAVPSSSSAVNLAWDAAADNSGVTEYRIYRDGELIGTTDATHYSDTGLLPETAYVYRISAADAAGNESALSDPVSAVTLDASLVPQTIRLEKTDTEVTDSFIYAYEPDTNFGEEPYMGAIDRFLVRFQLPASLNNKQILSASLGFYVWNQSDFQPENYMDVYALQNEWTESAVTWNRRTESDLWNTPGGDYDASGPVVRILHVQGVDHAFYPEADITALVQSWVDGTAGNYGLLVMNDCATGIGLKASEYGEGTRTYLRITYTDKTETSCLCTAPLPERTMLAFNYPNPFNPETRIELFIEKRDRIRIDLYNSIGQRVRMLMDQSCEPGTHSIMWNGTDDSGAQVPSGLYFYRISGGNRILTGKMQLLK
ncbi:DNRLRE domain-containing protein [bacterium]|nr:DNRLRE domain-containing protein [bacterium]